MPSASPAVSSSQSPSTARARRTDRRRSTSDRGAPVASAHRAPGNSSGAPRPAARNAAARNVAVRDVPVAAARTAPARAANIDMIKTFADLNLLPSLVNALAAKGIHQPTPIQAMALPDALAGRDVLGRAQTGSGKTLAFGLPLLTRLAANKQRSSGPGAVILLPTRELAEQVEEVLKPLAGLLSLHVLTVIGGTSITRQISELRRGVDVLIATPGRLVDLMQRRAVHLDAVSVAVLDEADHMANLGFMPAVTRILDAMPNNRQCLLFSATLDRDVDRLVARYMDRPSHHEVDQAQTPAANMEHRIFRLNTADKIDVAAEIAGRENRTLFFVRTKHGADRLAKQFRTRGIDAGALHGNLSQNQRRRALDAFTSGSSPVLVATDVAARGIHVDDLDLVVHFDLPADHKAYSHRSGRTARGGASGTVISLVEPQQGHEVSRIHAQAAVTAETAMVRPGHPAVLEVGTPARPRNMALATRQQTSATTDRRGVANTSRSSKPTRGQTATNGRRARPASANGRAASNRGHRP